MKIVHIVRMNNDGDIGGVEYHVRYLTQAQVKSGLTPVLVTFQQGDRDEESVVVRDGITWHQLQIRQDGGRWYKKLKQYEGKGFGLLVMLLERIHYNFYYKRVLDYVDNLKPEIAHQHDYLPSVRLSRHLSKKYPTVFTNHFGEYLYLEKSFLTRYIQKKLIGHFHQIIAPSKELLPDTSNSHHIPNGYDDEKFSPISPKNHTLLKQSLNCDGKVVFLCARRWAPTKGIIYFAQAINRLDTAVKERIVILFAGNESTDYELYKAQVAEELAKASECDIRLLGNLDHDKLLKYMQVCDIAVIPSLMEAISLFAIESFGSGKPVLASDTGGLPEIINHNKNGWLVEKGNADALASTINHIVSSAPSSLPSIDVDYYKQYYSWRSIASRVLAIYQTALSEFKSK